MKYFIILLPLFLVACGQNPPEPYTSCITEGKEIFCRGGGCHECLEYGITCPTPLKLDQNSNGKLICRLEKK